MVSVIVVTYNSAGWIGGCLGSIVEKTVGVDYEVIVVDNDSVDDTVGVVKRGFPGVRVIRNGENVGFAAANNLGAKEAKGEWLFFLNPDTELTSNAVEELRVAADRSGQAGSGFASQGIRVVLGANLVDSQKQPVFCGGNFPSIRQQIFDLGLNKIFPKYYKRHLSIALTVDELTPTPPASRIDYVCGAAMFMHKTDFEQVGGFDEGFFMYYEEVDLCRRLRVSGIRCQVVPAIKIVHHESASTLSNDQFNYKKYELLERSKYDYFKKHYGLLIMMFVKFLQVIALILHTPFTNQSLKKSLKITLNYPRINPN